MLKDTETKKYSLQPPDSQTNIKNLKECNMNIFKKPIPTFSKQNSHLINQQIAFPFEINEDPSPFKKQGSFTLKESYSPISVPNLENNEKEIERNNQIIKSPYYSKNFGEELKRKKSIHPPQEKIENLPEKNENIPNNIKKNTNVKIYTKRVIKSKKCDVETLEYVLRTKFANNHKTNMDEYIKKVGLNENTKVFCCNTQDDYIRRALLNFGWYENKNVNSYFFDLKWVYMDNENDYKFLIDGQFYNHFQNNKELTTKISLTNNMKQFCEYGINFDEFYPRCYDLGSNKEMREFVADFEQTNMMILLKKHIKYFKTKCPLLIKEVKKELIIKDQKRKEKTEKEIMWKKFKKKPKNIIKNCNFQNEKKNPNFMVNITLLQMALSYFKTVYDQIINFIDEGKHYDLNMIDKKFKEELMNYSKINIPYDEVPLANKVCRFIISNHIKKFRKKMDLMRVIGKHLTKN